MKPLPPLAALIAVVTVAHASDPMPQEFPPLPRAVTSFGAAVHDGWAYVYGGHAGEAHKYSLDTTLFDFRRVNLSAPQDWRELPGPARAQGASLVVWNGRLIRVGGLSARNETFDQDENLVSLPDVAAFDPVAQRWTNLPDLPAPRSSHDSVVIDDRLYVLGGWELAGSRKGQWHDAAWVLDLSRPKPGWKKLPQPFKRRAIAAAAVGETVMVLGGMDDVGDTSREVDLYDLRSKQWSSGPKLPAGPMNGFGAAACTVGDTIFASTYAGKLLAWQPGDIEWREVAELETKRFFHRMVPLSGSRLLMIGGASRDEGHLNSVEVIEIPPALAASVKP